MLRKKIVGLMSIIIILSMIPFDGSAMALAVDSQNEIWKAEEFNQHSAIGDLVISENRSTGSPDDFGYTWDDTEPYNWIDAKTLGTNIGLYGGTTYGNDPIPINFSFPFYGNDYSALYVTTNGLISFGEPQNIYIYLPIPSIYNPNNIIAPLWEELGLYSWGNRPEAGIYVYQGGVEPNRFLVIEWYRADIDSNNTAEGDEILDLTFEVILYENGDIIMQYQNLGYDPEGYVPNPIIGIENSSGEMGLAYTGTFPQYEGMAIRFSYPVPTGKVSLVSETEGGFVSAGQQIDYSVIMQNVGDLGTDTFELATNSEWPMIILDRDGLVEIVDPVTLEQGEFIELTIQLSVPEGAIPGDSNIANLVAASTINEGVSEEISWSTAVPVAFIQVLGDSASDFRPQALYVTPLNRSMISLPDDFIISGLAVAELPNRNQIYFGTRVVCVDLACEYSGEAIYFWIMDRFGQVVSAPTLISDWGSPLNNVTDKNLSIDVNDNGDIGIVWERFQSKIDGTLDLSKSNIYYLVLSEDGTEKVPQTNLTQDENWYEFGGLAARNYTNPRIAATTDENFTIGWTEIVFTDSALGYIRDIYLSVVDNLGNIIQSPIQLTASGPDGDATSYYLDLTLAAVNGDQVLVSWIKRIAGDSGGEMAILDSSLEYSIWNSIGIADRPVSTLDDFYARQPVVTQLSDSKIMLAADGYDHITVLIIDGTTFVPSVPLFSVNVPKASIGDKSLSITHDDQGRGLMTWHLKSQYNVRNEYLGYTLINSEGIVETAPMHFYRTEEGSSGNGSVYSNANGYGITTYHYSSPPEFISTPVEDVIADLLYSYAITATDADLPDEVLTITALMLPDWLDFTDYGDGTALLSGTPSALEVGDHSVELEVEDSFGLTDTQSFTITVQASEAPAFTSVDTALFTEGVAGSFTVETSGVPEPEIGLSGSLPTGVSFLDNGDGTATLSGTPGVGTGGVDYSVTLSATNGIAPDASQNFTLTVGTPPEFDSGDTSSGMATVGEYVELTETVSSYPENPLITISGDLPAGLTFLDLGTGTAVISGTPEADTGGIYTLTLTANNGTAENDTLEYTLTVKTVETIGAEGGTISSNGGAVSITVPSGSLTEELSFEFIPLVEPTEGVPSSLVFTGTSFQLIAKLGENVVHPTFDPPLVVEIHYDESDLGDMPEDELILYYWDTDTLAWLDAAETCANGAGYTYYPESDYFTVEICHLTEFSVMGEGGIDIFLPLMRR